MTKTRIVLSACKRTCKIRQKLSKRFLRKHYLGQKIKPNYFIYPDKGIPPEIYFMHEYGPSFREMADCRETIA